MDFFDFIFDLKSFKIIKKRIKRELIFVRVPRGCDVARKATWQSHAGPRERLRGAKVTRGHYLYLIVIYIVIVHTSIR